MNQEPALTWGYCIRCGAYCRGRPVEMIEDRAEAVDSHRGCSAMNPGRDGPVGPKLHAHPGATCE